MAPIHALRGDEAKMFEGQPPGFPLGDFDLEDIMLPEGEDFGIPSDSDTEDKDAEEAQADSGFGNVLGERPAPAAAAACPPAAAAAGLACVLLAA